MSDSEQRQLHVPYREYHSQNSTNAAALVDTDALVDLSVGSKPTAVLSTEESSELLPDVEFVPSPGNDQSTAIESPGLDRESQPLLGRLEVDVTVNSFPGRRSVGLRNRNLIMLEITCSV